MALTEEQLAALKRVAAYMDEMYSVASPYHGCTEDSDLLRAMIDSSEHVTEPTKMIGFDLERIKADLGDIGDPRFCDCEVRTQLAAAIAEIERLTVEHQNALDEVKNLEEQNLLRKQENERLLEALDESEKVVAHKTKSAAHWYDEFLQARADLVQTRCVIYQRDAKIKELEDALVEAKAAMKFCLDEGDEDENYGPMHDLPEWRELPEKDKDIFRDWCRKQLVAEGELGPDAKPRVWQITEERKAAIWHAVAVLKENDPDDEHLWDEEIAVLRAMLREAE